MGTTIQSYNLSPGDFGGLDGCNEILVRTRPDVIQDIHARFFSAGCDAVETDTFNGTHFRLAEYGLESEVYPLNKDAPRWHVPRLTASPRRTVRVLWSGAWVPRGGFRAATTRCCRISPSTNCTMRSPNRRAAWWTAALMCCCWKRRSIFWTEGRNPGVEPLSCRASARAIMAQVFLVAQNGRTLFGADIAAVMTTLQSLPVRSLLNGSPSGDVPRTCSIPRRELPVAISVCPTRACRNKPDGEAFTARHRKVPRVLENSRATSA